MGQKVGLAMLFVVAVALLVIAWSVASGGDGGTTGGRERVLAPIEQADILVLESFPPQYTLHVVAGLPNGCARAAGHEVTRSGDVIRVRVYNSMPTGDVVCTMIYGTYELNIGLGSDFQSGRQYRVEVNDQVLTLDAQ